MVFAVALGMSSPFSLVASAADAAGTAKTFVPWSQLAAKAEANYHSDGLAVIPTAEGGPVALRFPTARRRGHARMND